MFEKKNAQQDNKEQKGGTAPEISSKNSPPGVKDSKIDATDSVQPQKDEKAKEQKKEDMDRLIKELAEYKDKYLRVFAEFENARKRMDREKMEFIKYANEGLILEFLAVLDNLERCIEVAKVKHQDYDAFLKGVEMVMAQLYEMLKKNSVKAIDARGKKFDPHWHEPLMQEETDKAEEGTVLEEFQKGYMYGDRVLRTSKVKVAKAKSGSVDTNTASQETQHHNEK